VQVERQVAKIVTGPRQHVEGLELRLVVVFSGVQRVEV
jgi:hypothetical protein